MIYADDVDYWKTGTKRTPAEWVELAVDQLAKHGATDIVQALGSQSGKKAYLLQFTIKGARHRVVWPVLRVRTDNEANQRAADRQAATTLYHEIKWRCTVAARYGADNGFFQFRQLPDGRTVQEISDADLIAGLPEIMTRPAALEHKA